MSCECDVDFRCPNHDTEAEAREWSWLAQPEWWLGDGGGYDLDDPKHPTYADRLFDAVDAMKGGA